MLLAHPRQNLPKDLPKLNVDGLFLVLLQLVQAFTRGQAVVEAGKGGNFQLFSGNVTGKFIELVILLFLLIFSLRLNSLHLGQRD